MNLVQVLRSELTRIAKREARSESRTIRKMLARHRAQIAALRRELDTVRKRAKSQDAARPSLPTPSDKASTRFSRKGLISLRKRLGLSAENFGRLIGCGGQSVYNYEAGTTAPRPDTVAKIAAARRLSKRSAAEILAG
jgi:DNA-binding transcriptional regulator YiaG